MLLNEAMSRELSVTGDDFDAVVVKLSSDLTDHIVASKIDTDPLFTEFSEII